MNKAAKFINKILANQIQQYVKTLIHHDQEGCVPGIQGCFVFENQSIHHIKRKKNHNHQNRCKNKKRFDKIQQFMT